MAQKSVARSNFDATIIIRIMVGMVFISEGFQKLLLAERGTLRFAKIGLPKPEFLGPFVGCTELLFGFLVLIGLRTRWAAIPLLIIILVAIYTTKVVPFPEKGLWETLHGSRNDFCVLLGLIYLFIKGSGAYSVDAGLR